MTIDEAISKLKEDYILRSMLRKKNLNIQDELEDEIEDLEQSVITSKIIPELERYAKELLQDLECEVCLAVMKDANGNVRVENEYVYSSPLTSTTPISQPEPKLPVTSSENVIVIGMDNTKEANFRDIRVTIDNKVIQEKNPTETFIKTLQYFGLDNVARVGIICSGYNLVDKRKRTDNGRKWQHEVEGKWVFVYLSTPTKCKYILKTAKFLKKNIKIEAI